MMERFDVRGFVQDKLTVHDMTAFCTADKAFLISPQHGTSLCMTRACLDDLREGRVSSETAFLLVQRALASYEGSREPAPRTGIISPTFFLIDLTKGCNLQCRYCFRELEAAAPHMTPPQIDLICAELIGYCRRHRIANLSIQAWGGEPLIELPLIEQIRRRFDEAGMNVQLMIETNATLITPEVARRLKDSRVEIGVSIDGCAAVHDAQRPFVGGQPSFERVLAGIENLRQAGYTDIGSITVVTRNTVASLPEVIRCFAHDLRLPGIKLNLMRKTDRNRSLALELDDIPAYVDSLLQALRTCREEKVSIVEQNIAQRMANLLFRPCSNICNAHGCHGGYRMLSIGVDNGVYPCELSDIPAYRLGEVGQGDFSDMVQSAVDAQLEYFRPRQTGECAGCPWLFYCRGGCRSAMKYDCGDPCRIDRTECAFNRALYPRLVEILMTDPDFAQYLQKGTC